MENINCWQISLVVVGPDKCLFRTILMLKRDWLIIHGCKEHLDNWEWARNWGSLLTSQSLQTVLEKSYQCRQKRWL